MSVIQEQIQKVQRRLEGIDPHELLAQTRDKNPVELSSASDRAARRNFLRESLADGARADAMFERIIAGNELQDVNYLARGTRAARSVTRIAIGEPNGRLAGWGTGLFIAPNVLMTNHHVLSESRWALRLRCRLSWRRGEPDQFPDIESSIGAHCGQITQAQERRRSHPALPQL